MTLTKTIVTRDEIMFLLSLERVFMDRWSGAEAEKAYSQALKSAGKAIPPMPRIEGMGKSTRYHVATVEKWLLDNFQQGGAK